MGKRLVKTSQPFFIVLSSRRPIWDFGIADLSVLENSIPNRIGANSKLWLLHFPERLHYIGSIFRRI